MHPCITCYNADSCLKNFMDVHMEYENMCKHMKLYCTLEHCVGPASQETSEVHSRSENGGQVCTCHKIKT